MRNYSLNPASIILSFLHNYNLIKLLTYRDVLGRYKGSFLGILWSFFNPIIILIVYSFVFSVIFKSKWGFASGSKADFAMALFAGLMLFNFFAEIINKSPSLILSNVNYVKKVIFPLEILPIIAVTSALFHLVINFLVFFLALIFFYGTPHASILFAPFLLLPLIVFSLGASFLLCSLGVYLRDLSHLTTISLTVLMFLTPIFYPVEMVPEVYRKFIYLNPLTSLIEAMRDIFFTGHSPDLRILSLNYLFSFTFLICSFLYFQKTRKGFADVI